MLRTEKLLARHDMMQLVQYNPRTSVNHKIRGVRTIFDSLPFTRGQYPDIMVACMLHTQKLVGSSIYSINEEKF
uniref:Uncharacterized protein n=1 Tax=Cucumis melo TaxID=3656 RepID=A0A9I9E968_CUCME